MKPKPLPSPSSALSSSPITLVPAPARVQLDEFHYWKLKGLQANLMAAQQRVQVADLAIRRYMAEVSQAMGVNLDGSWDSDDNTCELVKVETGPGTE